MKPQRVGDLEIGQDLHQERLTWRIERVAWVLISLVLLAALLGLLGPGPLSNATAGEKGSALWVEFDRFARYQGPADLRLHLAALDGHRGELRVWVNSDFIEQIELESVNPQPSEVEVGDNRHWYVFRAPHLTRQAVVTFRFRPNKAGLTRVELGLEKGLRLAFSQFYYP